MLHTVRVANSFIESCAVSGVAVSLTSSTLPLGTSRLSDRSSSVVLKSWVRWSKIVGPELLSQSISKQRLVSPSGLRIQVVNRAKTIGDIMTHSVATLSTSSINFSLFCMSSFCTCLWCLGYMRML